MSKALKYGLFAATLGSCMYIGQEALLRSWKDAEDKGKPNLATYMARLVGVDQYDPKNVFNPAKPDTTNNTINNTTNNTTTNGTYNSEELIPRTASTKF
jgi:hypothetical protein